LLLEVCRSFDKLVRKKVAIFFSFNIGKLYNRSGEH
jgi:hypothetical protein